MGTSHKQHWNWTPNGCLVAHKRASNGSIKYDQDIFTQVNKGTDNYVPRITNINKVTVFLLYGPIRYLSKWILTHKKKEREIEGDMGFSGSLICDL